MARTPDIVDSFRTKPYFRSFSKREIASCISLALFLLATREFLDYYTDLTWIAKHQTSLLALSCFILVVLNHAFYRREHKRLNNFLGRIVHDCFFLVTFILVSKVAALFKGGNIDLHLEDIIPSIPTTILFIFLLVCLELTVAACRRILNLARWRVF
jgi:hypothetical protein